MDARFFNESLLSTKSTGSGAFLCAALILKQIPTCLNKRIKFSIFNHCRIKSSFVLAPMFDIVRAILTDFLQSHISVSTINMCAKVRGKTQEWKINDESHFCMWKDKYGIILAEFLLAVVSWCSELLCLCHAYWIRTPPSKSRWVSSLCSCSNLKLHTVALPKVNSKILL